MNVNSINLRGPENLAEALSDKSGTEVAEGGFKSMLNSSLREVNELVNQADQKSVELAIGKSENVHEAMIAMEKAETALRFMVQVRNKAIEAYNDILKMQV